MIRQFYFAVKIYEPKEYESLNIINYDMCELDDT